jgi:hypothetical protein
MGDNDWIEESGLRFEGFTDQEIAQIEAAIPRAQALIALLQKNEALFQHIYSEVQALLPTGNLIATKLKARFN